MIVNPWQCEIYDCIVLEGRDRIVDQQIGFLKNQISRASELLISPLICFNDFFRFKMGRT
jgi:hypothetical protein